MRKETFAKRMTAWAVLLVLQSSLFTLHSMAQQVRYGYVSYDQVLFAMPDYQAAQEAMASLRGKYAAEMRRVEDEFNKKYEQFLDGQREFAPSILHKRQAELQDMMEKNQAFKQESERLLRQAEADAVAPVRQKLATALAKIGQKKGYAFILNTDNNAVPYLNPEMGEDVTEEVLKEVKRKE